MFKKGVVDEVRSLLERNLDKSLPVMKALGVSHISSYLDSSREIHDVISKIVQDTRNYAKRQFTWFNNNFITEIISTEKHSKRIVSEIFSKIPN